jgi:hypothetical protein
MSVSPDIIAKIQRDFSRGDVAPAIDLVSNLSAEDRYTFTDQVLRCVLFLSNGSLSDLVRNLACARTDRRDVIYWAEYDTSDVRVRDHTVPFR